MRRIALIVCVLGLALAAPVASAQTGQGQGQGGSGAFGPLPQPAPEANRRSLFPRLHRNGIHQRPHQVESPAVVVLAL